ncbi:hypothetical protein [Paenibacillus larvae]|nr:hypothetical protein [Paenibacillus larvae]MDV3430626.1 hypothetical protein [Paenibacillus larvae]
MKGIHFTSKRGTEYYYDDLTGQIFPAKQTELSMLAEKFGIWLLTGSF